MQASLTELGGRGVDVEVDPGSGSSFAWRRLTAFPLPVGGLRHHLDLQLFLGAQRVPMSARTAGLHGGKRARLPVARPPSGPRSRHFPIVVVLVVHEGLVAATAATDAAATAAAPLLLHALLLHPDRPGGVRCARAGRGRGKERGGCHNRLPPIAKREASRLRATDNDNSPVLWADDRKRIQPSAVKQPTQYDFFEEATRDQFTASPVGRVSRGVLWVL